MTDPIKAALEAGVLAYASRAVEENPRRCSRVIAAFLRALEDDGKGPWVLPDDGRKLAAAVEAAAREG